MTNENTGLEAMKRECMEALMGEGNSGHNETKAMWECIDYLASKDHLKNTTPAKTKTDAEIARLRAAVRDLRHGAFGDALEKHADTIRECME